MQACGGKCLRASEAEGLRNSVGADLKPHTPTDIHPSYSERNFLHSHGQNLRFYIGCRLQALWSKLQAWVLLGPMPTSNVLRAKRALVSTLLRGVEPVLGCSFLICSSDLIRYSLSTRTVIAQKSRVFSLPAGVLAVGQWRPWR